MEDKGLKILLSEGKIKRSLIKERSEEIKQRNWICKNRWKSRCADGNEHDCLTKSKLSFKRE